MRPAMRLGLEGLQRVHLLAEADEADGLAGDRAHRQRRTAAAVAVHPGQDDAGDADAFVEILRRMHRVLTGEAVDHQKRLARVGDVAHGLDLGHELFVDGQPAGGVEHVDVVAAEEACVLARLAMATGSSPLTMGSVSTPICWPRMASCSMAAGRFTSSEAISTRLPSRSFRRLAILAVVVVLPPPCRPTIRIGAGGLSILSAPGSSSPQHVDKLVMDDLDDLLAGGDRFGDRCAGGLLLDRLDELARHGQRDVGLQQRHAHLAHGGPHVILGQRALLGEPVEDAAEAFGEVFEHGPLPPSEAACREVVVPRAAQVAQRVAGRTVRAEREATEADGPERRPETGCEEDRGGQDAEAMPLRQRHDQRRDGRGGKDRQHPGQKPRPIDDLDIRSCIHG
jgi:hypothetical protein